MGSDGKLGNVLKIRPPIVFTNDNADLSWPRLGALWQNSERGVAGGAG